MLPCLCIISHHDELREFSNGKYCKTGSKEHELISLLQVDEVVILFHGLHHQPKDDHCRRIQYEEDYDITEQIESLDIAHHQHQTEQVWVKGELPLHTKLQILTGPIAILAHVNT